MPNYTQHYDLVKPLQAEFYQVEDQNSNMDKIDKALKAHDEALENKVGLGPDGLVPEEFLPALGGLNGTVVQKYNVAGGA